jgi:hypothetical protein
VMSFLPLEMADSGDENIASTSSFNSNSKKKHRYDVRFKLEALAYAEKHSGEKAAKQFGVDSRRIREWKKQKTDLLARPANWPTVRGSDPHTSPEPA